jgi:hypothetical protein
MMRLIVWFVVLLVFAATENATVAQVKSDGSFVVAQIVGNWIGDISTGHCSCKDRCETGQSIFSQGRSVAQCKAKCQRAFSGCTKGEIRSHDRRD